jgi:predicted nucleic-acid-binding Zn-ribbon protein
MLPSEFTCPQCGSQNLERNKLGVGGSAWVVKFGTSLFKKKNLIAYACKDCGFVFLYLEEAMGRKAVNIGASPNTP